MRLGLDVFQMADRIKVLDFEGRIGRLSVVFADLSRFLFMCAKIS